VIRFDADAFRYHRERALKPDGSGRPMSAADLAEAVGATKGQILAYERGRKPDPARLRELAIALDVHPILLSGPLEELAGLAELRQACGFSAQDIASQTGVSIKSYRRFETYGLIPARQHNLLYSFSDVIQVSVGVVERVLSQSPEVASRLERLSHLIGELRGEFVVDPRPWRAPGVDDPRVQDVAKALARPPTSVARVLSYFLGEERRQMLRMDHEAISVVYELHPDKRISSQQAIENLMVRRARETRSLPERIDRFFRQALHSDGWRVMAGLWGYSDSWMVAEWFGIRPATLDLLPWSFVSQRQNDGATEIRLAPDGRRHIQTYREWYGALYPSISIPTVVRRPSAAGGRLASGPVSKSG
jgi:transcriptional regulator with XRE-family HTH domain